MCCARQKMAVGMYFVHNRRRLLRQSQPEFLPHPGCSGPDFSPSAMLRTISVVLKFVGTSWHSHHPVILECWQYTFVPTVFAHSCHSHRPQPRPSSAKPFLDCSVRPSIRNPWRVIHLSPGTLFSLTYGILVGVCVQYPFLILASSHNDTHRLPHLNFHSLAKNKKVGTRNAALSRQPSDDVGEAWRASEIAQT